MNFRTFSETGGLYHPVCHCKFNLHDSLSYFLNISLEIVFGCRLSRSSFIRKLTSDISNLILVPLKRV